MMPEQYICFWYDGNDYQLTRCTLDGDGRPIGLPATGESLLIIEYEKEQPTFYYEAVISEMGVDNDWP